MRISIRNYEYDSNLLIVLHTLIRTRDQTLIIFLLLISTYEILNISESIILKFNYSALIHSYSLQHWFISTDCNEYAYNVDIKLIPFAMCLIHKFTHSDS